MMSTGIGNTPRMRPLILDFDSSVPADGAAVVVPLTDLQEDIRFACTMRQLALLRERLSRCLSAEHSVAFLGSGDFHHVSYLLIERIASRQPVEVIVMDNHPDNMRYPLGVHCGSWVRRVAQLPEVTHVHVVGITSADSATTHLWENYWAPLLRGRLTYWCVGKQLHWPSWVPFSGAQRCFHDANELVAAFNAFQRGCRSAVYLSIDKDVLHPSEVRTNWDQGKLREQHLHAAIEALGPRIVASDITGEVSKYEYRKIWKQWLSARDAQPEIAAQELVAWQKQHRAVNQRLLERLSRQIQRSAAHRGPQPDR